MRVALSWLGGIGVFVAISFLGLILADLLSIDTYVDYGETITVMRGSGPTSYEEEVSGASTGIALAIFAVAIMVGVRMGLAISIGRLDGGISMEGRIDF